MATWAKDELDMAVGRAASEIDAVTLGIGRRLKHGRLCSSGSFGSSSSLGSASSVDLDAWVVRHPMGPLCSAYAKVYSAPAACSILLVAQNGHHW